MSMTEAEMANIWRGVAAELQTPEQVARERRVDKVITKDGRVDLYRGSGKLPGDTIVTIDAESVYVGRNGQISDEPNLEDRLLEYETQMDATAYAATLNTSAIAAFSPPQVTTLPFPNASRRGQMRVKTGASGAADLLYICLMSSGGTYSWKLIASG